MDIKELLPRVLYIEDDLKGQPLQYTLMAIFKLLSLLNEEECQFIVDEDLLFNVIEKIRTKTQAQAFFTPNKELMESFNALSDILKEDFALCFATSLENMKAISRNSILKKYFRVRDFINDNSEYTSNYYSRQVEAFNNFFNFDDFTDNENFPNIRLSYLEKMLQ